jgi:hypothetical protein
MIRKFVAISNNLFRKKRITFPAYLELTKHNALPLGKMWVWRAYRSGSQLVCRGTFLYRQLLPRAPLVFKDKNDSNSVALVRERTISTFAFYTEIFNIQ